MYYTPVAEAVVASTQRHKGGGAIERARLSVGQPQGGAKRGADDDVVQYYEQSARKGSVEAQLILGHLYYHGARGLPADVARAFEYYQRAADVGGDAAAYAHLGNMYAQGFGVEQSNETALEYFRKGAAKGHAPSQNGLGYMHMHGMGVERDNKRALEYFKTAAEKGNAEAQFNLGAMYVGGLGIKKAYDKALHYFTLSAHQGHTLALYNLGQMHLNGLGTPRSCTVGVQFLKAVAERGEWSRMLEEAHGAVLDAADPAAPLLLYATLAEAGFEVAQSNLAFLLDQHHAHSPRSPVLGVSDGGLASRALGMFKKAAQQGNVEAHLKLGDYYYYGHGVPADFESSVGHYRAASDARNAQVMPSHHAHSFPPLAARHVLPRPRPRLDVSLTPHRHTQAMFNLAYMYAHGLGLARDAHLAKRMYDMSADATAEAWAPVQLALLELHAMRLWEARLGKSVGDPYEHAAALLSPLRAAAELALLEWDTIDEDSEEKSGHK